MLVSKLSLDERAAIGAKIRDELEIQGLTQDYLASLMKVDARTVRNMLKGKSLTVPRLVTIKEELGIDFDAIISEQTTSSSAQSFGGYSKDNVQKYFGQYVSVQHSFENSPNIHCSFFELCWDDVRQAMKFLQQNVFSGSHERMRNYSQQGHVYISPDIGLLHILTAWRGAVRLITLSKLR